MRRDRWSPVEDGKLSRYIERNGGEPSSWENVPRDAELSLRTAKSCKLRWNTKLRKDINENPLSAEEKATIIRFQKQHGNKWEEVARLLQGRTATMIKNFWNALQKKLSKKDTQVSPRNPVGIAFGATSSPDASSIPAPVSASLEPSKADQGVEIVEDTPAEKYSDYFLQELLRDQEPSDRFMENIFTSSPDADGSQNIIN
ncbi:hypothetical protein VitviT2T_024418 [Vitis vinifera]|uniref:Uncharacterized protein n=1 Tax=Vitis vinifera TaxID=29760 RepID=A0ABY9DGJ4_VITVI|nr:transcription factor MYB46-like [Vitis vinifera]WKA06522.1 hypothetical protein VitviT2T_024418 [Vitis vinifera]|eukprot:XP_010662324.1 PREDICTED: transcription factor MYB46-like [Vitis vinifera]